MQTGASENDVVGSTAEADLKEKTHMMMRTRGL